jgi:mannitol/fructose-specific phosphotransferase system IIA component (Ntr-type)
VGGGLAVPHGVLDDGRGMVGAMGISRRGLPFDTPDGIPVHCVVVLATPPTQRRRHLEVLAALARAICTDQSVQRRLFDVKSPAHAYEILHAEEAEDFNYFLED